MRRVALFKKLTIAALPVAIMLVAPAGARADTIMFEGFDDVTALAGWTAVNNSDPGGATGWFQGNEGVFPAQAGADNSYIAANFLNAGSGAISNWLILPELSYDGDYLDFYTRSNGAFADRLEVRFSPGSGADVGANAASVGTFSTLFLTINPALNVPGYPSDWTHYSVNLGALDTLSGRLAFRYNIDDVAVNGDYIGIDSVAVNRVPEPGTLTLAGLGLAALIARRRSSILSQRKGA
jgi:hypothetical protein